jgi:hypothetical protein
VCLAGSARLFAAPLALRLAGMLANGLNEMAKQQKAANGRDIMAERSFRHIPGKLSGHVLSGSNLADG